jgi:RNA polymerase sigma-70 factor (ECF subfamily)
VTQSVANDPTIDVGELYRRYAPMVLRRVHRFYRGHEAEEVVHEVFLRVLEKVDGFRADASPVTWLYRITTNWCLNRLRNEGRRGELLEQEAGVLEQWQAPAPHSEARAFLGQLWRHVDEESALVGIYYHLDGMTHDEIARVMGCSPRTVGYRLNRLSASARELMEQGTSGG